MDDKCYIVVRIDADGQEYVLCVPSMPQWIGPGRRRRGTHENYRTGSVWHRSQDADSASKQRTPHRFGTTANAQVWKSIEAPMFADATIEIREVRDR